MVRPHPSTVIIERRLQLVEVSEDASSAFSLCETCNEYDSQMMSMIRRYAGTPVHLRIILIAYCPYKIKTLMVIGACSAAMSVYKSPGSGGCMIIISRWGTNTTVRERLLKLSAKKRTFIHIMHTRTTLSICTMMREG